MPFYLLSLRLYNEQLKNIFKSLIKFILETINSALTIRHPPIRPFKVWIIEK